MSMTTDTLLLTYYMTGNEKYLGPIRSAAEICLEYLENPPAEEPQPGSSPWCAADEVFAGALAWTCAKYRFLTGNNEFDELIKDHLSGYVTFRLTGDENRLLDQLESTAGALRVNFESYTSEVRFTDRVFLLHRKLFGSGFPPGKDVDPVLKNSPGTGLLYSMATGDVGGIGYFPLYAVRWMTHRAISPLW